MSQIVIFVYSNAGRSRVDLKSDMNIKKMRELIAEKLNITLKDVILSDKKDGKPIVNDKLDSKNVTTVIKGKSAN